MHHRASRSSTLRACYMHGCSMRHALILIHPSSVSPSARLVSSGTPLVCTCVCVSSPLLCVVYVLLVHSATKPRRGSSLPLPRSTRTHSRYTLITQTHYSGTHAHTRHVHTRTETPYGATHVSSTDIITQYHACVCALPPYCTAQQLEEVRQRAAAVVAQLEATVTAQATEQEVRSMWYRLSRD